MISEARPFLVDTGSFVVNKKANVFNSYSIALDLNSFEHKEMNNKASPRAFIEVKKENKTVLCPRDSRCVSDTEFKG